MVRLHLSIVDGGVTENFACKALYCENRSGELFSLCSFQQSQQYFNNEFTLSAIGNAPFYIRTYRRKIL